MKNILTKLFYIITFILVFAISTYAADFGITSVTYDNSSAVLVINTFDNDSITLHEQPKLNIDEENHKAYFDINSAYLKCPAQNLVLTSTEIKEVQVKQISLNPNIVRIALTYNKNFNPKNIKLLRLNNTLFIKLKQPKMVNYYFQHIYSDLKDNISDFYESLTIQTPILTASKTNDFLDQINSAFNISQNTTAEYTLSRKNLILPSKYYINNVNIKPDAIHINGIGSATFSKPIRLSNPTRIAYDIHSTVVNPAIRNNEFEIKQGENIKIGQFNQNTARVVITSPNAQNYIPVIYGDTQHLVFINKTLTNTQTLFGTKSVLNNITDEINDNKTHSMKLVFSKPIIYGIERDSDGLTLYLYNAEKSSTLSLKKSLVFDNATFSAIKPNGYKLILTDKGENSMDIHIGADGKTLRIKEKGNRINLPEQEVIIPPPISAPTKTNGKYYIVLDPGHGGSDCGAIRNNINEKDITLDVSKRVADLLRKKGYEVKMTRETDLTVSLQDRVEFSENLDPDIFVSIHVNSSNSETPNGIETHYYKDNSLPLAKTIHASMLNHISANNRGLFKSKFYVINHTTAPAILVEIGFISNNAERAQLVTESRKQATAKAIAEGINDYFKK
ncbi:MAG: N-acetylmuramoyl-L-alanine amidase [Muribaculaceae bacterium]|nr:N-acetylmuramoyl-L-alanine amidase [Muribaculaceae bacterium]